LQSTSLFRSSNAKNKCTVTTISLILSELMFCILCFYGSY
jgi:hypothetical protein